MKKWLNENIFCNNKKTLLLIGLSVFFVLFIYQICLFAHGTYFNSNSDDIVQYSPIFSQYIEYIKNGKLSWYNYSNNLGSSLFADIYYVPIDVFSLLVLLLSFFIDEVIAFSIVELFKIFAGVVTFGFFLQKCKYKNWIVVMLSFMYFCVGGVWVLSVFPTYFSMFFYLPCSLLVVKKYCEGKKWLLPLYGTILILYNFYNAYTLFIFMLIDYVVIVIRDRYKGIKNLLRETFFFGMHIILSVAMGLVVLLPSVLYILNNTARNSSSFQFFFDIEIYFKMISKLFVYETGTIHFIGGVGDKAPYIQNHFSYYIGFVGVFVLSFLFHMKDRTSKIYKWVMVSLLVLMVFPIFSMIISGVRVAYLRWVSFLNIILIYFIGHVVNNVKWEEFSNKQKIISTSSIIGLYLISFIYNLVVLRGNDFYYVGVKNMYYLCMLLVGLVFITLYVVFYFAKQKNLLYGISFIEMSVILILNLSVPFNGTRRLEKIEKYDEVNSLLSKLDIGDNTLERVYTGRVTEYNTSRFLDELTNERTFHSFLTKSIYDYQLMYKEQGERLFLSVSNLTNYSPSYSRSIDYRYIVLDKEIYDYQLDYLDIYYEDENYIVYENEYYEPFYVYESYYDYEDVVSLNEYGDYIELQKKLFKGVVLEENNHLLKKIEYDYNDSKTKTINAEKTMVLVKNEYGKYVSDFSSLNLGYNGNIYISEDNSKSIKSIKVVDGEKEAVCPYIKGLYECEFDGHIDSIVVESDYEDINLSYFILVESEFEITYLLFELENQFDSKYINYMVSETNALMLLDDAKNSRSCFLGFCSLENFEGKYAIAMTSLSDIVERGLLSLQYQEEDFNYYNENREDLYARDKSLTYDGSTVKVSYDRVSVSENDQVVVLPLTYSEEWVCEDKNYELVKANGGYLGLVVKNGVKNVDVSITFRPSGVKIGLIGSIVGFGIYGLYIAFMYYRKKKVQLDENI